MVRGACPHDCPDTCALQVTVQGGRVIRVPVRPTTRPRMARCAPRSARYPSAPTTPSACCSRCARRPQGQRPLRAGELGRALDDIATRLQAIAARDPQAILPYSYAGTMGLVQGEGMAARFFHKLGASRLDRTICANAGGDAWSPPTAPRSACTSSTTPRAG
jgi:hypothetical protein